MRVLEDIELFLAVAVARKRVRRVRVAVQMNPARHRDGNQAKPRRPKHIRQRERPADAPKRADHRADQRKRGHRVAHVPLVPVDPRHGQRGKHRERHANRLKHDQIRLLL